MPLEVIYKYHTSLESGLLTKPFLGFSNEGWVHEPFVSSTPTQITLQNVSFFYQGRPVVDIPDPSANNRLFHVTSDEPVVIRGLDPNVEFPPVAIGFYYPFTPGDDTIVNDNLFRSLSAHELLIFGGLVLGRLCFFDGSWHLYTDCADFAGKYFTDNQIVGSRVTAQPLKALSQPLNIFHDNSFYIRYYNDIVESTLSFLPLFSDDTNGTLVSVSLVSVNGCTLGSSGYGKFYALGFKSYVTNDDKAGEVYKLDFTVLGSGDTFNEAVQSCFDPDLLVFNRPLAVVELQEHKSNIIQFDANAGLMGLYGLSSLHTNEEVRLQDAIDEEVSTRIDNEELLQKDIDSKCPGKLFLKPAEEDGVDISTPAVGESLVGDILQTIWKRIRQVANKISDILTTIDTMASLDYVSTHLNYKANKQTVEDIDGRVGELEAFRDDWRWGYGGVFLNIPVGYGVIFYSDAILKFNTSYWLGWKQIWGRSPHDIHTTPQTNNIWAHNGDNTWDASGLLFFTSDFTICTDYEGEINLLGGAYKIICLISCGPPFFLPVNSSIDTVYGYYARRVE